MWAERAARVLGIEAIIHRPKNLMWSTGYKPRNLLIAKDSDEVHVIVVKNYPAGWRGMTFPLCYHCNVKTHIKSGGCWTGRQALKMGKPVFWHEIP